MDLDALRIEIDRIDEQILNLLSQRAHYAIQIGKFKSKNDLAVHSHEREEQIINHVVSKNVGPLTGTDVKSIFNQIIHACRNLQIK